MYIIRKIVFYSLLFILGVFNIWQNVVLKKDKSVKWKSMLKMVIRLKRQPYWDFYFGNGWNEIKTEEQFFAKWKTLKILTKQDYIEKNKDIKPDYSTSIIDVLFRNKKYSMMTGGSSKEPLLITMDKKHLCRMVFSFVRCWYEMGWKIGDKLYIYYPNKIYNLEELAKFNYYSWFTGIKIRFFDKLDDNDIQNFTNDIKSFQPDLLLVFPSTINYISHKLSGLTLAEKIDLNIPMINVSGETFLTIQRNSISRTFLFSHIRDSYGSVELGEIAHENYCEKYDSLMLEIFSHFAYIEEIDNRLVCTVYGETETNPMIRYWMGDRMKKEDNMITQMEGKDSNFISAGNIKIYPHNIEEASKNIPFLKDVRVVRETDGKLIIYVIGYEKTGEEFRCNLGLDESIPVVYVNKMNHDYRRKYRIIEDKARELEWAGGIIGQTTKMEN